MSEPQFRMMTGDAYLCDRALAAREAQLQAMDPGIERHGLFADELDISSLDVELRSCSLFALGRHFVIRKIEKNRKGKALAAVLDKPLPEGTFLTLLAGPLKATNAVLKMVKVKSKSEDSDNAMLSVLPTPKGTALQQAARSVLVASGLTLSNTVARTLLMECGDDLMALHSELGKLKSLAGDHPIPEVAARELCFNHTEATVYPFYDQLGSGNLAQALSELEGLREDAGRIVGGIIRHFTRLVMVRLLLDQRRPQSEIASMMGMQDWLCRRLIGQAKRRSFAPLAHALRLGVKLDQRIKQGRIAPDDALMQLILASAQSAV
jgi:DNA polymerase III delta subunit